jgi:hypothetical protein
MKIKVVFTHSIEKSTYNLYTLNVSILEGKSVLPGQTYICESDPQLTFTVKTLALGGYDYNNNAFPITIEKPAFLIDKLNGKTFIMK